MDKIESLGEGFSLRKRARKGARRKNPIFPFSSRLEETAGGERPDRRNEYEYTAEDFSDALELIEAEGEMLKKAPTMENVRRYRGSVKSFLRYVLDHILETEEQTSGANPLRKKRYLLIKVIDRRLEQLALAVLKGQSEQLNILDKVDEINGLVVDLVT